MSDAVISDWQQCVYFVQAADGGLIKIGIANDLRSRLKSLQAQCPVPLRCLAALPGYRELEIELHDRFSAHRRHGEWFEPAPELLELIDGLTEGRGIEPDMVGSIPSANPSVAARKIAELKARRTKLREQVAALRAEKKQIRTGITQARNEALAIEKTLERRRQELDRPPPTRRPSLALERQST